MKTIHKVAIIAGVVFGRVLAYHAESAKPAATGPTATCEFARPGAGSKAGSSLYVFESLTGQTCKGTQKGEPKTYPCFAHQWVYWNASDSQATTYAIGQSYPLPSAAQETE